MEFFSLTSPWYDHTRKRQFLFISLYPLSFDEGRTSGAGVRPLSLPAQPALRHIQNGRRGQAPALLSESVCRKAPRKGCLAEFRRPQTAEANQNLSFPGTCASEMTLLMAEGATISQEIESLPPCNPSLKSSRAAFERHRPYRSLILKPMPQTVLMYSVGLALASLARRLEMWTLTVLSSPMYAPPHTCS